METSTNVILTTLWLIVGASIAFFLAKAFAPEHLVLITSLGLGLSTAIRFMPEVLGDVISAIIDSFI